MSRVTILITHIRGLIALLATPMNLQVDPDSQSSLGRVYTGPRLVPLRPLASNVEGLGFRA